MEALFALQNGSDIRGIGIGTEEHQVTLTDEALGKIGHGLLAFLRDKKKLTGEITVAVGHDSRLSAERIKAALVSVLKENGIHILDAGLATTPAMFMATQYEAYSADAGIMITASHLPYFYNGIKVFTKEGGAEKADIRYILEQGMAGIKENEKSGSVKKIDLMDTYAADLVSKIRSQAGETNTPLSGSKIIVDAGNGAGGFFAEKVLVPLGADTAGSQFLEPDGHFPNHIPNPDNDEAMASLRSAVLKNKADLGIIFDTDVDRAAIVDAAGDSLNRNALIAVISAIILESHPGTTIVTDSTTSSHLERFIRDHGGKQHRFKRGYRNVINEAIRLNESGEPSELAIEVSGHAALKENYFLDDGAYLVAKILVKYAQLRQSGEDLSHLIQDLVEPEESREVRIKIDTKDFKAYGEQVLADFLVFAKETADFAVVPNNYEGVRVNLSGEYGSGWLLLRMSLHEPVMPLNIELDRLDGAVALEKTLASFFNRYQELNYSL
ncbi:putative phosphomannomutase [Listeria floridensis FSL S10-1187]|uniref:Phosphomannomutase n=1 Tax=Listeria floridensis FSL S10-1187 TaxID=1265817 RepID=A0ABN0RGN2_9LIST|nr:phosphoglucomutase [Listeria floridensis]EUJ32987.1 putative phosphomannomutase [Listeria floridensis FSL S10-1187]